MATDRVGFIHVSNKMRSKWEDGVRRNRERLLTTIANFRTWEARDGWNTDFEYMRKLEREIRRQEQYLRNRGEL